MGSSEHWDHLYDAKGDRVSWFRPRLERSIGIIDGLGLPAGSTAIDVGGGASTLVDDLLARGFSEVVVVDLSQVALRAVRIRLGGDAARARLLAGDITKAELPAHAFDLWHDRAVFHFLIEPEARAAYVRQLRRALRPGGHVVISTFGPNGPERCSGLPVVRYDEPSLHAALGEEAFTLLGSEQELHETPGGAHQEFLYCSFRLDAD